MRPRIHIAGRPVGPGAPVFIVAEMSANHGQELERAVAILEAARDCGADAVKLQTYTPDTLTLDSDHERFRIGQGSPGEGRTLYELYGEAYTPWEWHPELKAIAEGLDLILFSSPFDASAVEFLEEMEVPAYKVASFELVDLPLIRRVAATGKPVIVSTGMGTLDEIEEAVTAIRDEGNEQIALLKCTSAYPAPPEEMNLRTIPHLAEKMGLPVGLSDHTLGIAVPVAAVALGASIVEKHLTLSRRVAGPDSAFSLEPEEFRQMVESIRTAEAALGRVSFQATARESASREFRRSLYVVRDLEAGEVLSADNVRSIRPAHGLHPRHLEEVLGRRVRRRVARGTPLAWRLIEGIDEDPPAAR